MLNSGSSASGAHLYLLHTKLSFCQLEDIVPANYALALNREAKWDEIMQACRHAMDIRCLHDHYDFSRSRCFIEPVAGRKCLRRHRSNCTKIQPG